jgi:hypothetical protein
MTYTLPELMTRWKVSITVAHLHLQKLLAAGEWESVERASGGAIWWEFRQKAVR